MMRAALGVLAVLGTASAFSTGEFNSTAPPSDYQYSFRGPASDEFIVTAVGFEQVMAKTYLDLVMRLQQAYYTTQATDNFDAMAMKDMFQKMHHDERPAGVSTVAMPKLDIMAHYNLFHATKIFFFRTVFGAAELQQDFFKTRSMQLSMGPMGEAIPREITNLLYLDMSITFLKVQKLSAALRTCAAFTTWLEDEIDITTASLLKEKNFKGMNVLQKDLTGARLTAFQAYSDYAMLDATSFSMELYMQYQAQGLFAAQAQGAAAAAQAQGAAAAAQAQGAAAAAQAPEAAPEVSMLEMESQTQAKTKFVAALAAAPFVVGGEMGTWQAMYTGYQKYAVYGAASAGYQASAFAVASFKAHGHNNERKQKMFRKAAKAAWTQFSSYSRQAANMDYVMAIQTMYTLFIQPNAQAPQ